MVQVIALLRIKAAPSSWESRCETPCRDLPALCFSSSCGQCRLHGVCGRNRPNWISGPSRVTSSHPGFWGNESFLGPSGHPQVLCPAGGYARCPSKALLLQSVPLLGPVLPPNCTPLYSRGTFKLLEHLLNTTFTQCPKEDNMFLEHCSILSPVGRIQSLFY